ncbi:DNA gyrase inhibitor YacG [Sphingomonas sp. HDW15A]|uniref:DNA gyrase inhibitor YacG n=1 Tax=Sphingomonas sp. HDW15A TaxID=2714942 RepID=UPI001409610F|nr:DNA gyrase inhibitor YacG [Sphingomonas sp. HDW15A]QIK96829.1 DNA gyrase inhibitor YacG [Sphingomonas sp. HDW15A]
MPKKPKDCPVCGKPPSAANQPFCSRGCKDRDLLKWLGDGYRIPGPPAATDGLDSDGHGS